MVINQPLLVIKALSFPLIFFPFSFTYLDVRESKWQEKNLGCAQVTYFTSMSIPWHYMKENAGLWSCKQTLFSPEGLCGNVRWTNQETHGFS